MWLRKLLLFLETKGFWVFLGFLKKPKKPRFFKSDFYSPAFWTAQYVDTFAISYRVMITWYGGCVRMCVYYCQTFVRPVCTFHHAIRWKIDWVFACLLLYLQPALTYDSRRGRTTNPLCVVIDMSISFHTTPGLPLLQLLIRAGWYNCDFEIDLLFLCQPDDCLLKYIVIAIIEECDLPTLTAFPLRKFFKQSLTHGPLNLCNDKTVRVNDSPYFQFWSHTVPPPIPIKIIMPYWVIRPIIYYVTYVSSISN